MALSTCSITQISSPYSFWAATNTSPANIEFEPPLPSLANQLPAIENAEKFHTEITRKWTHILPQDAEKPLLTILQKVVTEENEMIRKAQYKSKSFWERISTEESWDEIFEHRTALGRVIDLFDSYIANPNCLPSIIKRLNPEIIEKANKQAQNVLEQLTHYTQVNDSSGSIFTQLYDSNGNKVGDASSDTNNSSGSVFAQSYDSNLNKLGDAFKVSSDTREASPCIREISEYKTSPSFLPLISGMISSIVTGETLPVALGLGWFIPSMIPKKHTTVSIEWDISNC